MIFACVIVGIIVMVAAFFLVAKHQFDELAVKHKDEGATTFSYFLPFKNGTDEITFLVIKGGNLKIRINSTLRGGSLRMKLEDADGNILENKEGKNIDYSIERNISKGKYKIVLDFNRAFPASAILSVAGTGGKKATYVFKTTLNPERYEKFNPDGKNFMWPYYLYIPEKVRNPHLLVVPNNSGFVSDGMKDHEEVAKSTLQTMASDYGESLGCPVLVPVFPRWEKEANLYTQALDRDALTTNIPQLKRLDLQLVAMIDDARNRLLEKKIRVKKDSLFFGFSASGMFVNRFALLHPEYVKAATVGSPGGWPIAPAVDYKGKPLTYPIGISDVDMLTGEKVDLKSFRHIPLYFYLGSADTNDSVPYEDSYEQKDASIINNLFGKTPVGRWSTAQSLYKDAGCDAQFVLYPGVGHTITEKIQNDIIQFLKENSKSE